MIEMRVIHETIDYTKYKQKPTKYIDKFLTYIFIGSKSYN